MHNAAEWWYHPTEVSNGNGIKGSLIYLQRQQKTVRETLLWAITSLSIRGPVSVEDASSLLILTHLNCCTKESQLSCLGFKGTLCDLHPQKVTIWPPPKYEMRQEDVPPHPHWTTTMLSNHNLVTTCCEKLQHKILISSYSIGRCWNSLPNRDSPVITGRVPSFEANLT